MRNNEITTADLIHRLIEEFGYPPAGAKLVAEKLVASSPMVKVSFLHWWRTGVLDTEMEIEGYTLTRLIDQHTLKPIAAFLTLDWLVREPETARAVIARGYDRIKT